VRDDEERTVAAEEAVRKAVLDDLARKSLLYWQDKAGRVPGSGGFSPADARAQNDTSAVPSDTHEVTSVTSDTPTTSSDSDTPNCEIVSITDPAEIRRWDKERTILAQSAVNADSKTFANNFSWRKRYDGNTRTYVWDLYDSAGTLSGHRRSQERADRWCENAGVVT
jgi:hypothetical protein